ncbi:MAG: undecaprenyldiphospho-muramoylpentapeptide beta-N-acetylglucosaminyltransferase [Bdellovibrionales bacterium]
MAKRILIAAGGTGGHIYPALAIAEALRQQEPDVIIEFVGTAHGLENKLIPPKGYKVHHLPIGRLNSNVPLTERLTTLLKLPLALWRSFSLLRKIQPELVLGVGGHASGPLLLAAAMGRYRTAIWEPNAMPGMANRWLARFVDECWVVFEEAKNRLRGHKVKTAGMPVRSEIEKVKRATTGSFHVLIFGGSQGARGVNTVVADMIKRLGLVLHDVDFTHQTGAGDFDRVIGLYGAELSQLPVDVKPYIQDMASEYAKADLVVCRSGTGSLSELAACGVPAILIPFPFASDDHQRKNAESLVDRGAALMILQKDLTAEKLCEAIAGLKSDPERLKRMGENMRQFHHPGAAMTLAKNFLERIENHATS